MDTTYAKCIAAMNVVWYTPQSENSVDMPGGHWMTAASDDGLHV